ncbi:MAG TPA: 2-dehydropantoate 2-reductase [Rheinheimera sp.]|nr:2-dehydropantoate 2-reductase [Rheinheimera sp.]
MQTGIEKTDEAGQQNTAGQRYCVGIVGAGSIGCFLGAYLCQDSGLEVKFFGRETTALELAAHGLSATSLEHTSHFVQPVAFYTSLNSLIECDVVLLTVKATALIPMLAQLKRFLRPEVPLIAMQNGIGVQEMLSHDLPNPIVRAIVPFNVVKVKAGHYHKATAGELLWQTSQFEVVNYLVQCFERYDLNIELMNNTVEAEYGKLLLNLNNALNAISNLPLKQQLQQRGYRKILSAAMKEWLRICKKSGITPKSFTRLPSWLLPKVLALPDWLFGIVARPMLAIDPQARSSMWDDIQAHKRTEIMFLNGAVVRLGQLYQSPTPVNALLVEQIKLLESGEGASLSAPELAQRLRAVT